MEQQHKDVIREHYVFLLDNMSMSVRFVGYLYSKKVLLLDELEELTMDRTTRYSKAKSFCDMLVRKGPHAFDIFLEALEAVEETFIREKLQLHAPVRTDPKRPAANHLDPEDIELLLSNVDVNKPLDTGPTLCQLAVDKGKCRLLSYLIQRGADINAKGENGHTLLHRAAQLNQIDEFRLLATKGLSVESQDCNGLTPLHMAIVANSEDIISYILTECDVDVNVADKRNRTALHLASETGNIKAVRLLLAKRACCETKTHVCGITPLDAACYVGHLDIVTALLDYGANINVERHGGATPLFVSCQNGHSQVVELLLQRGANKYVKQHKVGCLPLWVACQNGHKDVARLLLQNGAGVDDKDNEGVTPLWKASHKGCTTIVEDLLDLGADVNTQTRTGATALCAASEQGHTDVVKVLLASGADVNKTAEDGSTALWLASRKGHVEVVNMLINSKANVEKRAIFDVNKPVFNVRDVIVGQSTTVAAPGFFVPYLAGMGSLVSKFGIAGVGAISAVNLSKSQIGGIPGSDESIGSVGATLCQTKGPIPREPGKNSYTATALHVACRVESSEVALSLLTNGANVDSLDDNGETPLHWACRSGRDETVAVLLNYKAAVNSRRKTDKVTPLHIASYHGHHACVKLLLENGAEFDITDDNGMTPLHNACASGQNDIIQILIQHGAKVNQQYEGETSPLHYAAHKGHDTAVNLLLNRDAETNALDGGGHTPLHLASTGGHKETVQALLQRGASMDIKGGRGITTPLHYAARRGHSEVVKQLLDRGAAVNAVDIQQRTPLHEACAGGHVDCVKLLLQYAADGQMKGCDGKTPRALAKSGGFDEILSLLPNERTWFLFRS